jgi:DNA-binding MarR family transcriptional regulator
MAKINANPPGSVTTAKRHPHDPDRLHRDLSTAVIAFHETCARQLGMSATERKCLGVLWQMKVATAGELARATGLTTGAITGIADRLEKAGYLKREANPADRRSVLLSPRQEKKLRRIVEPQFQSLTNAMAALRKEYSARDLATIYDYLNRTTAVLRDEAAKLKPKT